MILAHQKLILLMAFVAIVLAFAKLKAGYHLYSNRAMRLMTLGGMLLIFGATIGLAGVTGVLGAGYSHSLVYFILESVVGYVCGWTLIIWGMSIWLPYLFSVSGRLQKKTQSLTLYESITRLASFGDASPATFGRIASTLLENFGYQAASLHIPDKNRQLILFASVGLTKKSQELISSVKGGIYDKVFATGEAFQTDESIRFPNDIQLQTTTGTVVDALSLSVDYSTNRFGVMTIYTDHPRVFSRDELSALDTVCANLALAFYRGGLIKSINTQKSFKDLIAIILKTTRSEDNFNTRIIRLAKLLKQFMKFRTMHLYIISDGAPQTLDFNLPPSTKVIIERGFWTGNQYLPVNFVMNKNRSLILPDEASLIGSGFKMSQDERQLYVPVVSGGNSVGALCIAMSRTGHITQDDMIAADAIAAVVSGALQDELNASLAEESFDRIGAIKYSLESAMSASSTGMVYRELARIIVDKMPATFCRIMLLNPQRNMLQTTAIYQRRQLRWDERTITGLALTELYTHRKVLTTGKPLVIKDIDSKLKISDSEAKLLMPEGISQCMITPIIIDGVNKGVITIGENRRAERTQIDMHKMIFALLLTNVISMLLMQKEQAVKQEMLANSNRLATRELASYRNRADTFEVVDSFNSRINGPLAGILASCEFLKSKPQVSKEEVNRYLEVINKNASKIHKLTGQFAEARRAVESVTGV